MKEINKKSSKMVMVLLQDSKIEIAIWSLHYCTPHPLETFLARQGKRKKLEMGLFIA